VDSSAIKLHSALLTGRKRQGLRRLSSDLLNKAIDDTATQVTRIGLTFLGTAAFCLLSLLTPDSALLGGSEKINVPFAGPVSFFGFMMLGPIVLIMLRVYLQIYVEHGERLERLRGSVSAGRAPILMPLKNPLIRFFSGLTFYLLLPIAMLLFARKAAVFPAWGAALLCIAVGVIASHAMLPLRTVSWRSKALLSVSAATIAGGIILGFGSPRRQFDLNHANLSNQWLRGDDLGWADLREANLTGADLRGANLHSADLRATKLDSANLSSVDLSGADLTSANLHSADLTDADLSGTKLDSTDLRGADLFRAKLNGVNLWRADLSGAMLAAAKIRNANLSEANLSGTDLSFADLSGANLSSANLTGARLSGTHLTGARLRGTTLTGADFSGINMLNGEPLWANLTGADLSEACGDKSTRLPEGFAVKPCSERQKPRLPGL
jgi:uncharacterized protein YjbI with pentapeptide repeats